MLAMLVGDEERGRAAQELDEVEEVEGDGVVRGGVGGIEEVDDAGDLVLGVDAG